jgi:hypothetical protein
MYIQCRKAERQVIKIVFGSRKIDSISRPSNVVQNIVLHLEQLESQKSVYPESPSPSSGCDFQSHHNSFHERAATVTTRTPGNGTDAIAPLDPGAGRKCAAADDCSDEDS